MTNLEKESGLLLELLEKERIRELLWRLARAIDRVDEAGIAACYTDDSFDDHGPASGTGAQFAASPWRKSAANIASTHVMGQTLIDLRGDTAYCESYFLVPTVQEINGTVCQANVAGRYLDRVVRRDGEWLVQYRRVVMDWADQRPATTWETLAKNHRAKRWPDDAVYAPQSWGPLAPPPSGAD